MYKVLRYIFYTFAGLLTLVLVLILFTQTGLFRQIVKKQMVEIAKKQLNGEITLENLDGNFFTNLSLGGFSARLSSGDTVFAFDNLTLKYSLWPLLKGNVYIDSVVLDNPRVNLIQESDTIWNFQKFFPASADEPDTTQGGPVKIAFNLGFFRLNKGYVGIIMTDSVVPRYISDLNIELSGYYSSRSLAVDLKHLGFVTPPGIVDVKHFQFSVSQEDSVWSLKDFALVTPGNRIGARGTYAGLDSLKADVETAPLRIDEFAWILPDFKLGVTPLINLESKVENNSLNLDLTVRYQDQELRAKGKVNKFTSFLDDSLRHEAVLDLSLFFREFDPQKWLVLTDVPLRLNGRVNISGNGLAGSSLPLKLNGDFSGSRWAKYQFRDFGIRGSYLNGAAEIESHFSSNVGAFNLNASANLNDSKAPVDLRLVSKNFPAGHFLPDWGDSTILNMDLRANGTGNNLKTLNAGFSMIMRKSVAARVPVDSMFLEGRIDNGNIQLDTLLFQNKSLHLSAKGEYGFSGDINSEFETTFINLDAFRSYVEIPVIWQSLSAEGHARGRSDSLLLDVLLEADSLQYDTVAGASKMHFSGQGLLSSNGFNGSGNLELTKILASGQRADSLTLEAFAKPDFWDAELALRMTDSLLLRTHVLGNMQQPFRLRIPMLNIVTPYDEFIIAGEGPHIYIDSTRMELEKLELRAKNNKQFMVNADGIYQPGDSVNLRASVENFDLSSLQKLSGQNMPVSGVASVNLEAKGPLSKPEFDLKAETDRLKIRELRVKTLNLDVKHRSDTLKAFLLLKSPTGDSVQVKGTSLVFFSLSDSQMISSLKTVDGRLLAKNIRPSSFFEFDDPDQQFFKALLNMDIKVKGEVSRPFLGGYIRVANGQISFPAYGIKYTDLKLMMNLDSNKVMVDSLFARNEKGTLLISGNMKFDETLVSGNLSDADLSLKAKDFFLSRHRNHEIQINADAWMKINRDAPVYGGNLTILRSSFYLPALLNMGSSSEINKPLLVQALEDASEDSVLLEEGDTLRISRKKRVPENDLMKKLSGKLNVRIPRNTWVKSEDMNLELYGDFDLLKNNEYFELFGTLGISRGYYTLYGRKLIIQEGELSFQGGQEINPLVNLEAVYQFRGKDKQKNELIMKAGGTAFEPELSFTLNSSSITERDAMAYLIFNQSFDELSLSNQEGVSGSMPSAMLSGLVSSQLTKTIGKTFDLDMVEVKAGDNWESATFMVGKYITNNLFVTYQRGFGENEEESLTPQTITLEYELARNLFFRLTQGDVKDSGVDVILKFEKD